MSDYEEEHFLFDRKDVKRHRKEISARDRSKYKKTDKQKYLSGLEKEKEDKLLKEGLLAGRVLSISPQGMVVDSEHALFSCTLKGLLKKEKTHLKNLVTVGDFVLFEKIAEGEGIIVNVKPRYSVLSRADNLSRRKEHILAANIDQVLITTSVVNPPMKPPLIDRYIIAAQKGNMEPVILLNKVDLLDDPAYDTNLRESERVIYEGLVSSYEKIGIPIIPISVKSGVGLESLKEIMKNKASVFSGQSGVGKSSLINAVTGLELKIGDIVEKTKKGSHTTTTAQLIPLEGGGWCIDTPGIRSFGVWDLKKDELQHYYTEIFEKGLSCKFPDCSHTHEQDCAVLMAVENGEISKLRYESYAALLESIQEQHLRR